jgi:hypothetical protein
MDCAVRGAWSEQLRRNEETDSTVEGTVRSRGAAAPWGRQIPFAEQVSWQELPARLQLVPAATDEWLQVGWRDDPTRRKTH